MAKLIAFMARKGSGKSTAAQNWNCYLDSRPSIVPFAYPLKAALIAMGVPWEAVHGSQEQKELPLAKFGGKSGRELAQTLGTEWGRNMVDRNLWPNIWKDKVLECLKAGEHVVVDDLRFPNENEAVKALGGMVVKIVTDRGPGDDIHPSEAFIDSMTADYTILNTFDITQFRADLAGIAVRLQEAA